MGVPASPGPVPPGWHPDPGGRHPWRWWDGAAWSATVIDAAGHRTTDPLAVATPARRGPRVALWIAVVVCVATGLTAGLVVTRRGSNDSGGGEVGEHASAATAHTVEPGETLATAEATIGPEGGTVVLGGAAPVDGFELLVPAGALGVPTPITVEAAPIDALDAGPLVSPLSPLYTVHAGDAAASDVFEVTVPVAVPDGWIAMGFFVDPATGDLEGMPLLRADDHSVTVGTRHFSSFFVSGVLESLLPATVTTGFDPIADTWQFPNQGSTIAPGGHCAGMSLTAMWFFLEERPICGCHLRGRYDDATAFAVGPATPSRWVDDVRGLRWASSVQKDIPWVTSGEWNRAWHAMYELDPALQLAAFRYSMAITGEPQLVALSTESGLPAHAMVAYAVDGSTILVADPNSPSRSDTGIDYRSDTGGFVPFASAATLDGPSISFTRIGYAAKSALFDWDAIGQRFAEAESGTIGLDRFQTPDVVGVELTADGLEDHRLVEDGYVPTRNPLPVYAAIPGVDGQFRTSVYVGEAAEPIAVAEVTMVAASPVPTTGTYALVDLAASPQIGVLVEQWRQIGLDGAGAPLFAWRWVDFRWLSAGATTPTTTTTSPSTAPPATAPPETAAPPDGTTYDCTQPRPPGGLGAAEWDLHCGGPIGATTTNP